MAVLETGNNTAGAANIDGNFDLMVSTPQVNSRAGGAAGVPNYVGATRVFFEKDSGSLTGTPMLSSPISTFDDNLQVGLMTPLMDYSFNGTTQDTANWYYAFSTLTASQSGGNLLYNSGNIGTSGTGAYIQSKRYVNLTGNAGLRIGSVWAVANNPVLTNELWAFGLGVPVSTTALPTDGVWIQYNSAGLQGILYYNGTLTSTGVMPVGGSAITPTLATFEHYQIRIHDRLVDFMYNGIVIASISMPAGNPTPFMWDALPVFSQYINTGTVSGAQFMQIKQSTVYVDQLDSNLSKPYSHIQAAKGLSRQVMQGTTVSGPLSFFTNSTNPSTAAPGNTSLTANLPNLLQGGQGLATYWNLASTDMIMHQAQVPVGSINITPRTMYITGVRISAMSFTAAWTAPAAGAHAFLWSVGHGGTTASLAGGESASYTTATAKTFRRTHIGIMTWATGAAVIGTPSDRGDIIVTFATPIVLNPGEYLTTICKMLNGAATGSGGLFYTIDYDHYFE